MHSLVKLLFLEAGCHSLCFSSEEPSVADVVASARASRSKYMWKIAEMI